MAAGLTVLRNPNVAINKVSLYLFIYSLFIYFFYSVMVHVYCCRFFLIINKHFICYLGLAASPASGLKSSLFLFSTKSMQQLSRS